MYSAFLTLGMPYILYNELSGIMQDASVLSGSRRSASVREDIGGARCSRRISGARCSRGISVALVVPEDRSSASVREDIGGARCSRRISGSRCSRRIVAREGAGGSRRSVSNSRQSVSFSFWLNNSKLNRPRERKYYFYSRKL